jgi:diacylglycerol O-acyltransferase
MQPFDALLFRGENNPRTRSMLVAACVLERAPSHDRLTQQLERATRLAPRLRQKVVSPSVWVLLPCWIVDPDFDLRNHLRFTKVSRGATLQAVLDIVQQEVCARLDPARPLWEALLVEGLRDGMAALVIKMSHAVTDGVGAQRLFNTIFDHEPDAQHGPMPGLPIPEDVTPEELTREALEHSPVALTRAAIALGRGLAGVAGTVFADPAGTLTEVRDYLQSVRRLARSQGPPAPALRNRSAQRRCAAFELPLEAIKRAGKAAEASINDVYLCGIAETLCHYLAAIQMPADTLPVALPVNLRRGDEPDAGNYFGAISFALPVSTAEPRERVATIRERVRAGRAEPAIGLPQTVAPLFARLPPQLADELARRTPLPDIQASNIIGSAKPLYLAGARVHKFWPFGPVPGVAAMFTMQSLSGVCHVGVNFDDAAITRPEQFVMSLQHGFQRVLSMAGPRSARVKRPLLSRGGQQ